MRLAGLDHFVNIVLVFADLLEDGAQLREMLGGDVLGSGKAAADV